MVKLSLFIGGTYPFVLCKAHYLLPIPEESAVGELDM